MTLSFCLNFVFASAQSYGDYSVLNITEEDGLPSNEAYHVIEDKEGYLWFSTDNGLAKYNGQSIIKFDANDGLPNNIVHQLYIQDDGSIVGECSQNQYFKIVNDSIIPFSFNENILEAIPFIWMSHSYYFDNGKHHFGTKNGAYIFDEEGQLIETDTLATSENVRNIKFQVRDNSIFAYSVYHSYYYDQLEFLQTNEAFEVIERHLFSTKRANFNHPVNVARLNDNQYAVNFWKLVYVLNSTRENQIIDPGFDPVNVTYINDQLWISTMVGGIHIYEEVDGVYHFKERLLNELSITSVFKASDGNIWCASREQGVFLINVNAPKIFYEAQINSNISCFYKDSLQWLAGFDNGKFTNNGIITAPRTNKPIVSIDKINGEIIISGDKSYTLKKSGRLTITAEDWITSGSPQIGSPSKINDTLIAGIVHSNIVLVDLKNGERETVPKEVFRDKIMDALVSNDLIYVSSASNIYVIDPIEIKRRNLFEVSSTVKSLFETPLGVVGLSEEGELLLVANDTIRKFHLAKIPEVSRYTEGSQHNGKLYIATDIGIYTWQLNSIREYPILLNFEPIPNVREIMVREDSIYYVTKKRVYVTKEGDEKVWTPDVYLESTKINNREVSIETMNLLESNQNNVEFGLSFISTTQKNLNYRYQLIGHDLNTNTTSNSAVAYSSLPPGDYTFRFSGTCNGISYSKPKEIDFTIKSPIWRQLWFILVCAGILILILVFIYTLRVRSLKNKMSLNQTIANLKSQALAAQLNPHLIYNILNSIQGIIVDGDTKTANSYVSKFSRFMRLSLELSKSTTIGLDQELSITSKYLELEKLRFQDEINFEVINKLEKNIEKKITVPPLIIQPLIENSIKHGVMPSLRKDGKVIITVDRDENAIFISVQDNGKGFLEVPTFGNGLKITLQRLKNLHPKNDLFLKKAATGSIATITLKAPFKND